MRTYRYVLCDVFTRRPLEGNQLAVFTDARGMDDGTMQAVAREMNLSETVFVLRAAQGGHARIRIFTPRREVPFAGHPVLGAAFILAAPLQVPCLNLETGTGIVQVRFDVEGNQLTFGTMAQPLPTHRPFAGSDALFEAMGASGSRLPLEVYDNGIRHVFVVLESQDQVAALRPQLLALATIHDADAFSVCAGSKNSWKTRMFAPALGVDEDPATGSAAGPLAWHLARHGLIEFGQEIRIEQGAEIGRPSTLYARPVGTAQKLERLDVGGAAVIVARGELRLP